MNQFEKARRAYENIPIPEDLGNRVEEGIRMGREARLAQSRRRCRRAGMAACLMAVLLVALNVSPTVANAAANVPVLGGVFRVLTFVSYDRTEDSIHYDVSVPRVEADSALAERVNALIQEKVDQHMARAQKDWADYREAFFATGGTQEQWGQREMDVIVDYEVKSQTDTRLSFVVTFAEGWVASMEERYCYNLDLDRDQAITLRDVLGEDWVERCNAAIREQIDASVDVDGFTYFFAPEEGGFTTVDEATSFYIREDGVPVVVFPRYAIAAGAAGFPEFPVE